MEHSQQTINQTEETTQIEQTTQSNYCTYENYGNTKLNATKAEQKPIPGTGPQANPPSPPSFYNIIPLMYNTGTAENPILSDLQLEGCELVSTLGIQAKPGQQGRMDYSILAKFDLNNQDHLRMVECLNDLFEGCAYILETIKGTVKMFNFKASMAEATGLKHPVYKPRDEVTGDVIPGRAPSIYFKLFKRGKPPVMEQTLFTDLEGNPIPWELLEGVELKFIPLLHVKRMYVGGGKASIQMEMLSAVVTSVKARGTFTNQTDTINRLRKARPDLQESVAAQLATLYKDRQDRLVTSQTSQQNTTADSNQNDGPTFAAAIAPDNSENYSMGGMANMGSFVSQAPDRFN